MPELDALLSQIPLFAALPREEIEYLAATLRPVAVEPGRVLLREGEPGGRFYIVVEGAVEIVKALGTADERVLNSRGPGEFFGEMSLLDPDGLRTASVRADPAARLLEMSRADFDALLARQPAVAYELAHVLSERLRAADDATIQDLREKNRELTEAYRSLQAAQAQIVEKEKLEQELKVAARIQQSILPKTLPRLAGYDLGARMVPARVVGGDLFDFIRLPRGRMGLVVGDVSGKGVPAGIFMALTRSLIRAEATRTTSLRRAVERVNRHLLAMNDSAMFVTFLYGVLDPATHQFTYVRAGHAPPIGADDRGELLPVVWDHSLPLGFAREAALDEQTLTLPASGALVLYTDGATDARGPGGDLFGVERLQGVVREHQNGPAQVLCDRAFRAVVEHTGPAPQDDDVTLVAVCWRGAGGRNAG